jgi:hypothetical protein
MRNTIQEIMFILYRYYGRVPLKKSKKNYLRTLSLFFLCIDSVLFKMGLKKCSLAGLVTVRSRYVKAVKK